MVLSGESTGYAIGLKLFLKMEETQIHPYPDGYTTDRELQSLTLHGRTYSASEIRQGLLRRETTDDPEDNAFLQKLNAFLTDWFSESPYLRVHTSGSTGTPKERIVRKEQMMQSALLTCRFLGLRKGDKALLCMPLDYIAGKMMVVRSLVAGLDLYLRAPSGHPFARLETPSVRFAALIPLQVYNSLQVETERQRLSRTDILIIGGGAIDRALEKEIQTLPNAVYSTYGMTETLSHIALRRLNGPEASSSYTPFPSVKISLSKEETLVIEAPGVCDERLETNDIAHLLPDGSFTIVGRKDNIINSGGVKIQIECVEEALRSIISATFAIISVPHPKFGEAVVLLIEKETGGDEETRSAGQVSEASCSQDTLSHPASLTWKDRREDLKAAIDRTLEKYLRPKYIAEVDAVPQTGSGKINRAACRHLAMHIISKTL